MRKKNIWIFNHYATDMYKNHGGRHYYFAKYLLKKGYNVKVFCANTYHNKEEYIKIEKGHYKEEACDNIPFVFVKTISSTDNGIKRVLNMVLFYINIFRVSKKISKKDKPDIIIASSVHPLTMVAGIKIARKIKTPCICEIRDLWPEAIFSFGKLKENSILGKILIKGEHWIYKNASALIFTKPGDTDYLKERNWTKEQNGDIDLNKCYYINNGVDLRTYNELIQNNLEDEDLKDDKFNVVYTGAIRPVNNVGNLLDTAKLLKDNKEIQFLIYGEGNQLEELKQRLITEEIDNVKLKGYVTKQNIPYILSKSSVNILNYSKSLYNWSRGNSSNKLFEYMAAGKPIISTVKMGYDIIEKYKCGISLDNGTSEELAQAIEKIYNINQKEYDLYCSNAKLAAEDFDFERLTEELRKVIEKYGSI